MGSPNHPIILKTRGGDFNSFFTSCIVLAASLLALWVFWWRAEPCWIELWETFLSKRVRAHSPIGTMGWKAFHRATDYPMFALLPVFWMFAAFCVQRVLPVKIAKALNCIHALLILAVALATTWSFFTMLSDPAAKPPKPEHPGSSATAKHAKVAKI